MDWFFAILVTFTYFVSTFAANSCPKDALFCVGTLDNKTSTHSSLAAPGNTCLETGTCRVQVTVGNLVTKSSSGKKFVDVNVTTSSSDIMTLIGFLGYESKFSEIKMLYFGPTEEPKESQDQSPAIYHQLVDEDHFPVEVIDRGLGVVYVRIIASHLVNGTEVILENKVVKVVTGSKYGRILINYEAMPRPSFASPSFGFRFKRSISEYAAMGASKLYQNKDAISSGVQKGLQYVKGRSGEAGDEVTTITTKSSGSPNVQFMSNCFSMLASFILFLFLAH